MKHRNLLSFPAQESLTFLHSEYFSIRSHKCTFSFSARVDNFSICDTFDCYYLDYLKKVTYYLGYAVVKKIKPVSLQCHLYMCRLRWEHSLTCMSKKEVILEEFIWRWQARMWPNALEDLALWHLMTWAPATTLTVILGLMHLSLLSLPLSLLSALENEGSVHSNSCRFRAVDWLLRLLKWSFVFLFFLSFLFLPKIISCCINI